MSHREEDPRGRPRTRWRDYVSQLAWERLGIPPEELKEVYMGNLTERRRKWHFLGKSFKLLTARYEKTICRRSGLSACRTGGCKSPYHRAKGRVGPAVHFRKHLAETLRRGEGEHDEEERSVQPAQT
ncbi:hypothetical protein L3Q82_004624 [Scortum barcoo]|uniref:Uncharacterized protein n=1 Tax=Scortum barcoo TaxID=214431 RepID=A0ACB8VJW5_9TELE|nr:hypothetical protein L3Q82_004624 [Scortum barcoo]